MTYERKQKKPIRLFAIATMTFILAVVAGPASSSGYDSCTNAGHLFHIASNCNNNVVRYDVCLDGSNNISISKPVRIYWLSSAGKTYDLNIIENILAYGLKSVKNSGPHGIGFSVTALKNTAILVELIDGKYSAIVNLGNGEMVIDRVYVNATNRIFGIPTVNWVDIVGRTRHGNGAVTERIASSKD